MPECIYHILALDDSNFRKFYAHIACCISINLIIKNLCALFVLIRDYTKPRPGSLAPSKNLDPLLEQLGMRVKSFDFPAL